MITRLAQVAEPGIKASWVNVPTSVNEIKISRRGFFKSSTADIWGQIARCVLCVLGEGYQEDVFTGLPHEPDPGSQRPLTPSLFTLLAFPVLHAAQGHSLEIAMWCGSRLDCVCD